jgi:DNA polymerase-1
MMSNVLLTIDYAQLEPRVLAHLANEKELINAFKEGLDFYSVIAKKLLNIETPVREIKEKHKKERNVCKTVGLAILYGTGAGKLQEILRKELGKDYSINACRRFIEDYRSSFSAIKNYKANLEREMANRKVAYGLLGRPIYIDSNDDLYMKSMNTLVQGSASDLVIWSQTNFVVPELKALGVNFTHRMLIHDEVVLELASDEAELLTKEIIIPAMTTKVQESLQLSVPLAVEYSIDRVWHKP